MFDWIKRSVRNAVIAGINEAIAEMVGASNTNQGSAGTNALPPEIRLCLPAPTDGDSSNNQQDGGNGKAKSNRKIAS